MSRQAWLTKNSIPAGRVSLVLTLPADEGWRADFLGAFLLLTQAENWQQFETLTPDAMADEWRDIFLDFEEGVFAMVPVGSVLPFAGASIPGGWLLCDGQAVSRTEYAALFSVIADWYGFGDGSTTFNVPNLVGRVAVMRDAGQTEFDYLGEPGGDKTHILTTAEMPVHTHIQDGHTHTQDSHTHVILGDLVAGTGTARRSLGSSGGGGSINSGAATAVNQAATAVNQNAGSGSAHNNMPPYLVLNYIIKT